MTTGDLDDVKEKMEEEKERHYIEEMIRKRDEAIAAGKPMNELPPIPITKKEQAAIEAQERKEKRLAELMEKKKKTFWEDEELEDEIEEAEGKKKNVWGAWGPVPPWWDGLNRIVNERHKLWTEMKKEKEAVYRQWSLERQKEIGHLPPPQPKSFPDDHPFAHLYNPPHTFIKPLPEIESGTSDKQNLLEGDAHSASASSLQEPPLKLSQSSDTSSTDLNDESSAVNNQEPSPSPRSHEAASPAPNQPLPSSSDEEGVKQRMSAKAVGKDSSRSS